MENIYLPLHVRNRVVLVLSEHLRSGFKIPRLQETFLAQYLDQPWWGETEEQNRLLDNTLAYLEEFNNDQLKIALENLLTRGRIGC
jgi:hypothetical protein